MNYIVSCLFVTMLLGVGYSECNESNWQEYYPDMSACELEGADLQGVHLKYANLNNAELAGANLSGANLQGALFSWAELGNTNLSFADLSNANFSSSNLYQANLHRAILTGANFSSAYCFGTFFVGADLEGATFSAADLTYAYFDETGDCWGGIYSCDGYDDVSYNVGYDDGAQSGDLNLDGISNILDVVTLVNQIFNN